MTDTIYWALISRPENLSERGGQLLSPSEMNKLCSLRFPKRRDDWLLGRSAAKLLVRSIPNYQHFSPDEMEIQTTPEGAPYLRLPSGSASQDCLSISHCDRHAMCAFSLGPALKFGVDLEKVEPRSEGFVEDYFTPAEREMVHAYPLEVRDLVATLVWSLKEAMLKALGVGLRWDTRQVEIADTDDLFAPNGHHPWREIQVDDHERKDRSWAAWWQRRGDFVLTIAGFTKDRPDPGSVRLVEKGIRI